MYKERPEMAAVVRDYDSDSDDDVKRKTCTVNDIAAYFQNNMILNAQRSKLSERRLMYKPTEESETFTQDRWDEIRAVF